MPSLPGVIVVGVTVKLVGGWEEQRAFLELAEQLVIFLGNEELIFLPQLFVVLPRYTLLHKEQPKVLNSKVHVSKPQNEASGKKKGGQPEGL